MAEQLLVPQAARSGRPVAQQIQEALAAMDQEPLRPPSPPADLPPAAPSPPVPPSSRPPVSPTSRSAAPAAPPWCPDAPRLLLLACWIAATRLLSLGDPARFDPAWLLRPELPSRRAFRRWTLGQLQTWLQEQFGLELSQETIRQCLLRMGLSWKKARKLLARADTQQRQAYLDQLPALLTAAAQGQLLLVYWDEAHLHLDTDLGYGWAPRGLPFHVHSTSPGLLKVSFYGLYLVNYQAVRLWPAPVANSDYTISALERLRQQFPEQPILVIWDGASYHRSQALIAAAERLQISLLRLPAYSPDFMPVEALWRWLRESITAHHCHATVAELLQRVADFAATINLDPESLANRLVVRSHLDSREEELRLSIWK